MKNLSLPYVETFWFCFSQDCGGASGFEEFLEALNPEDPEHSAMAVWLDPHHLGHAFICCIQSLQKGHQQLKSCCETKSGGLLRSLPGEELEALRVQACSECPFVQSLLLVEFNQALQCNLCLIVKYWKGGQGERKGGEEWRGCSVSL